IWRASGARRRSRSSDGPSPCRAAFTPFCNPGPWPRRKSVSANASFPLWPEAMPVLHVCPLSRLTETVAAFGPSHVVSLLTRGTALERPASIAPGRHLVIDVSDILEPMEGHVLAGPEHME